MIGDEYKMLNFLQSVQFAKEIEKKIIEYEQDIDISEATMLYEIAKHDFDLVKNLADTIKRYYFKTILNCVQFILPRWECAQKIVNFVLNLFIIVARLK